MNSIKAAARIEDNKIWFSNYKIDQVEYILFAMENTANQLLLNVARFPTSCFKKIYN